MSESRYDDDTLAAYAEGILPEAEAAELVSDADADHDLAARLELAQRMLERPVLGPVQPPAALASWLREEVAKAAEVLDDADEDDPVNEPDLLEGGVDLGPVEVPARLTEWVRDAARQAVAPVGSSKEDSPAVEVPLDRAAEGALLQFPTSVTLLRAAAALLVALGLGALGGWIARGPKDTALVAELQTLRNQASSQAEQLADARAAKQAAWDARDDAESQLLQLGERLDSTEAQRAEAVAQVNELNASLEGESEALALARQSATELKQEHDDLASARAALEQERDDLAQRLAAGDPAAGEALAQAKRQAAVAAERAQQAEGRARDAQQRSDALDAQVAALQAQLAGGEDATFAVARAQGVERWEDGRWRPLADGAQLAVGDLLCGRGQAALQVGRRQIRLGRALYRVNGKGLEPLPTTEQPVRRVPGGVLAARRAAPEKPGALRRAGAALLPFLR